MIDARGATVVCPDSPLSFMPCAWAGAMASGATVTINTEPSTSSDRPMAGRARTIAWRRLILTKSSLFSGGRTTLGRRLSPYGLRIYYVQIGRESCGKRVLQYV